MVVKVYVSEVSGSNEIRERQTTILLALKSKNIEFEVIDITVDETAKLFMQTKSTRFGGTSFNSHPIYPLPPQIFNEEEYCGDYTAFEVANENKELPEFLKL
ncbi:SH3 domain-binding glutamic acid-rich protein homolog [Harmonia axyridis]|uniref:SH3 domain-binding glutamic acid-rich protein homolog n=1 Tax=Harmonia axyridis TaxID=115357 RepID=UPI001E27583C|nr:SH3 domain-binding glutamic acid-rich protein homolog [Harmonia axyridis]